MSVYATHFELRDRLDKTAVTSDGVLDAILAAASAAIDGLCNRPDGFVAISTATARYFAGSGKSFIRIDECVAITAVAVKDAYTDTTYTAWDTPTTNLAGDGDWLAFAGDAERPEFDPTGKGRPYTGLMIDPNGDYSEFIRGRGLPTVKVTAKWGYSATVPANVKEACIAQAARWFKRGESAWADATAGGELGVLLYRQALDPDVKNMLVLARLVRPAIG